MNYLACKKKLDKATKASDALFGKLDLEKKLSSNKWNKNISIDW